MVENQGAPPLSPPTWLMAREHWSQLVILLLMAGSMLAGATYFIVGHIDAVQYADQVAIASVRQDAQNSIADARQGFSNSLASALSDRAKDTMGSALLMNNRVTTLEAHDSEMSHAIDRLSTALDQQRAVMTDLGNAVTKLTAVQERGQHR